MIGATDKNLVMEALRLNEKAATLRSVRLDRLETIENAIAFHSEFSKVTKATVNPS